MEGDGDATKHPTLTAKNVLVKAWKSKNGGGRWEVYKGALLGKGLFSSEVQNDETGGDKKPNEHWQNIQVFVSTNTSRQQESEYTYKLSAAFAWGR